MSSGLCFNISPLQCLGDPLWNIASPARNPFRPRGKVSTVEFIKVEPSSQERAHSQLSGSSCDVQANYLKGEQFCMMQDIAGKIIHTLLHNTCMNLMIFARRLGFRNLGPMVAFHGIFTCGLSTADIPGTNNRSPDLIADSCWQLYNHIYQSCKCPFYINGAVEDLAELDAAALPESSPLTCLVLAETVA